MVNANRRPVAPVRKLVAAVLGTIAMFVMLFGLGMTSWTVVALGAAMLALAIGLTLVNVVRRGARTWVAGTAHVTNASEPPASSAYGRCELQIVVAAPGLPTSAVKVRDSRVPIDRWPVVGDTLPVSVDVDDMRRVRIQWDQVPTHTEAALGVPPAYPDPLDDLALEDDLLAEPEAPPWVTRERHWGTDDIDTTADLTGRLDDLDVPDPRTPGPRTPGPRMPDPRTPDPRVSDAHISDARISDTRVSDTRVSGARASGLRGSEVRADELRPGELREQPVVVREAPGGGPVVLEGTLVDTDPGPTPLPRRARPSPRPRPRPTGAATATVETDQTLDELLDAGSDDADPHDADPHQGGPRRTGPFAATSTISGTDDPLTSASRTTPSQAAASSPPTAPSRAAAPQPSAAPSPAGVSPGRTGQGGGRVAPDPRRPDRAVADFTDDPVDLPLDAAAPAAHATYSPDGPVAAPAGPTSDADPAGSTSDAAQAGRAAGRAPSPAAGTWPAMWPMDHPERDVTPQPVDVPTPGPVTAPSPPGPTTKPTAAAPMTAAPTAAGVAAAATAAAVPDPAVTDRTYPDPQIDLPLDEEPDEVAKLAVLAPDGQRDDVTGPDDTADRPVAEASRPAAEASSPAGDAPEAPTRDGGRVPGGAAPIWPETDPRADEHIEDLITAYPSARPGPAAAIHGVGITVLVTDLERAVRFYRDMLGFFEIDGGNGSAVLASGDTRLVLRTVHDLSAMTGRLIYLNLEVGDLDAVHADLRDKGVKFVHGPRPVNRGDRLELWAASFHDPDGHNIAVTQWRALP